MLNTERLLLYYYCYEYYEGLLDKLGVLEALGGIACNLNQADASFQSPRVDTCLPQGSRLARHVNIGFYIEIYDYGWGHWTSGFA